MTNKVTHPFLSPSLNFNIELTSLSRESHWDLSHLGKKGASVGEGRSEGQEIFFNPTGFSVYACERDLR